MKKGKRSLVLLVMITLFAFLAFPVSAADFRIGDSQSGNVTVSEGEELSNLYVAGNMISINGSVNDDLVGAGNTVLVKKNIQDDLWIGGGTVTVQGDVGGSIRAAGGNVVVDGKVARDILVAAGNITLSDSASVDGDVWVAGGVVQIDSDVRGDLKVAGGQVVLNGPVSGEVQVRADENLRLTDRARIGGDLRYKSPQEADIAEGATIEGEVDFQKKEVARTMLPGFLSGFDDFFSWGNLMKMLMMIVVGLILVYLFKKSTRTFLKEGTGHYWKNLGLGLAALILVPIVFLLLIFTVIGSWLAVLLLLAHIFVFLLSLVAAAIILGSWLLRKIGKKDNYPLDWKVVVVGVVLMSLISALPVVGWLACFLLILLALGSIYSATFKSFWLK